MDKPESRKQFYEEIEVHNKGRQVNQSDEFNYSDRSHQPLRMKKWPRFLEYVKHMDDHIRMTGIGLRALPGMIKANRNLKSRLFQPIRFPKGFGLSTDNDPALLERVLQEIIDLKAQNVLIRIPVWRLGRLRHSRRFLEEVKDNGINVMAAVIQDRYVVKDTSIWKKDLEVVFKELSPVAGDFEIGHAWNRIKWGVHSLDQYLTLLEAAEDVRAGDKSIRFVGPAVIDFEYHYTLGALFHKKRTPDFSAVSALLYVDRRGAPENRQSGFDLVGKLKLLRAIVDAGRSPDMPVWITETNWPLAVRGGYSPTSVKEGISEELYADYMVRYYLNALASGMTQRVYWWQVAARGYGIIDNPNGQWRRRPSWKAFRTMSTLLHDCSFIKATIEPEYRKFEFRTVDDRHITAAWSIKGEYPLTLGGKVKAVISRDGEELPVPDDQKIELNSSPVYILY